MKLTEDVKKNQGQLSRCNTAYLEFVENNPDALKRANYSQLTWPDEIIRLQPWPTFCNGEMKNRFYKAGLSVLELLKSIPGRLFSDDPVKLSRYLEIPLPLVDFYLKGFEERQLDSLLGRGDFILSHKGELKCIEFNVASNLGGWELALWEAMYVQHPITSKFIRENRVKVVNENLMEVLLEHVVEHITQNVPKDLDENKEINLGLALESYDPRCPKGEDPLNLTAFYRELLRRKDPRLHGRVITGSYPFMRSRNGSLCINHETVSALLIYSLQSIPMRVLNVFYSGKLFLFNSPITGLLANKLNVALLSQSEDSPLFSPEERRVIQTYIPWTRKTEPGENTYYGDRINLQDFVLQQRRKLIIKPSKGSGARGMLNGTTCSEEEWRETVQKAFKERHWLVQEYIPSASFIYQLGDNECGPCYPIWGPFIFGKRYGGTLCRTLPVRHYKGAISSSYFGAEVSIILEVDE